MLRNSVGKRQVNNNKQIKKTILLTEKLYFKYCMYCSLYEVDSAVEACALARVILIYCTCTALHLPQTVPLAAWVHVPVYYF